MLRDLCIICTNCIGTCKLYPILTIIAFKVVDMFEKHQITNQLVLIIGILKLLPTNFNLNRIPKMLLLVFGANYIYREGYLYTYYFIIILVAERVPEIRFSGTLNLNQPKNGLKASWTTFFSSFCQFFAIFDDFSKIS